MPGGTGRLVTFSMSLTLCFRQLESLNRQVLIPGRQLLFSVMMQILLLLYSFMNRIPITMKQFIAITLLLFFCRTTEAQEPFAISDLNMTSGTSFTEAISQDNMVGLPGMDQTWDFSSITENGFGQTVSLSEVSTSELLDFPDAEIKWCGEGDGYCRFLSIGSGGFEELGFGGIGQEMWAEPHPDPLLLAPLPFSFGDTYSGTYVLGESGIIQERSQNLSVDGYGTLILPWGEVQNAYRIHGTVVDTFTLNGELSHIVEAELTYFFAPGYPGPLVESFIGEFIVEGEDPSPITVNIFLKDIVLGIEKTELLHDLKVFPNPASQNLTIQFENSRYESFSLDILDIQGRIVYSEGRIGSTASVMHQIDLHELKSGLYFLRLRNGRGFQTEKIQICKE